MRKHENSPIIEGGIMQKGALDVCFKQEKESEQTSPFSESLGTGASSRRKHPSVTFAPYSL
jgi:hypothetical protein